MSPVMEGGRLFQVMVLGLGHHRPRKGRSRNSRRSAVASIRALMTAEVATYEWDVVSDRLFADRNLERIFGVALDAEGAAPLANFIAMIHPDDQARVVERATSSTRS